MINTKAARRTSIRDKKRDALVRNILRWAKKIKSINYKGGKCCRCGEDNPVVLSFHHCGNKEKTINDLMSRRAGWDNMQIELDKCELLCENCHREVHEQQCVKDEYHKNGKKLCLELTGGGCGKCGYDRCMGALEFHHIDSKIKTFGITKIIHLAKLSQRVIEELEKCHVYCVNCHKIIHDKGFFERHKKEIYEKSISLQNKQHIDPKKVMKLNKDGLRGKEIAARCGYSYERVYEILRANGVNSPRRIDGELVLKLISKGASNREIIKQAVCSESGVRYIRKNGWHKPYDPKLRPKVSC